MELDILMTLQWRLNFSTVFFWLGCYLELLREHLLEEAIEPLRIMAFELLDLAIHTPGFVVFPYSMLAASALLVRLQDPRLVLLCSRYQAEEIAPCVDWLWSFFRSPDCIIYFNPEEVVEQADYDDAISNNYRTMSFLSDCIRHETL